jgi:hypothetical protein
MYGVVLMLAMTGAGQGPGGHWGHGYAGGFPHVAWSHDGHWQTLGLGTPLGMGYGALVPAPHTCCGVVMPPVPPLEMTTKDEFATWIEYVKGLELDEQQDMMCVWRKADVCTRRRLLMQVAALREQVAYEVWRDSPYGPLTPEELRKWENYVNKLKGARRKEAEEKWEKADNKGKRQLLEEIDEGEQVRNRTKRRPSVARR